MIEPYITDIHCAYECNDPVEIVDIRFLHSSDESGHACCLFYRCLSGHRWMKDLPPDHIDQELQEMFG